MKKLLLLIALITMSVTLSAQTTKTMIWGGTQRQYMEYVPSTYDGSTPAPVIFTLHDVEGTMGDVFQSTNFQQIAEENGWIIISPQALPFSVVLFGTIPITVNGAWNAGISAVIFGQYFVLNGNVDDSGFMMAILDNLIETYNINQDKIYFVGFSLGGYMTNRMAIEHSDRIKAIVSVNGPIGNEVENLTPAVPVSAMHIHGTNDPIVNYETGTVSYSGFSFDIGKGAEETVEYWRSFDNCSTTPEITYYPDIVDDGLTFEKYLYTDGTNDTKVALIKVNGGQHEWYNGPDHDIDYTQEIYNFLTLGDVSILLGDANDDGEINVSDIMAVISYIYDNTPATFNPVNADANGDGAINVIDVQAIIYIIQSNLN